MRDYGKITPKFWIGETGRKIKASCQEATIVALYLMTSPHANMLGYYYMPISFIAHETGLSIEGASKGLESCIKANFCSYHHPLEVVWVHKMALFQVSENLKPEDKRTIGVANAFIDLPVTPFLAEFVAFYGGRFNLPDHPLLASQIEAPSKPLRSQEQEQEQEQEQKTTSLNAREGFQEIPTDAAQWAAFFVNVHGFQIHEAQTARSIPMFADWTARKISIADVDAAVIAGNNWLASQGRTGPPDNPCLYGKFLETVLANKGKNNAKPNATKTRKPQVNSDFAEKYAGIG